MRLTRRLLAAGRLATGALIAAVALGVAAAALAVVQAWLLARTIAGAFLGGEGIADLAVPLAGLAVVLGARPVIGWASDVAAQRISGLVKADLRRQLLTRVAEAGPGRGPMPSEGELVLLLTRGLDALDGWYGRYLPQLALGVVIPLVVVVCLLAVDAIAAITVLLTVPLIPVFMALVGRMSAAHRARRWAALGRLAHRFTDVVGGLPVLRAYGRAEAQVEILRRITDTYRSTTMATLRVAFLSALVLELLATISVALVAVGIALRLVTGGLTLEVGLFALVLAPEAYLPLRRLGAEFHASEEGLAAAAAAFAIIDADPAAGIDGASWSARRGAPVRAADSGVPPATTGVPVPDGPLRLEIHGVSVAQPGRDVLAPAEASLVVGPGEVVALTGPSGAGKSTLVAVILGLLAADAGRVTVGPDTDAPRDVRDLDRAAWHRAVAWVPQAPYLFAGTVAENVRLGAPDAGDAMVRAALDAVGLADVPADLALGERGSGLSSGQRRRVGIARALARHARVLLLDEPTAGLDEAAERVVMTAIRAEADRGAAVLVVSHRPGAVAGADRTEGIDWRSTADEPAALEPGARAS